MFGFALWDARRRRLLLGRDRLGIKPLYVHGDGKRLVFATEAKAMLALPGVPRRARSGRARFVPEPRLRAGTAVDLPRHREAAARDAARRRSRQGERAALLAHPRRGRSQPSPRPSGPSASARASTTSVRMQMVSDVPIGALPLRRHRLEHRRGLHGAAQRRSRCSTYSIGFDGRRRRDASTTSCPTRGRSRSCFGTEHHEIVVKPDVVGLLPRLALAHGRADRGHGVHHHLSRVGVRAPRRHGDPLRRRRRRAVRRLPALSRQSLPGVLRAPAGLAPARAASTPATSCRATGIRACSTCCACAKGFLASADLPFEERYRSYVEVFPRGETRRLLRLNGAPRRDAIADAFRHATSDDALNRMLVVDAETQLPDDLLLLTDKMSMAVSLECRVPLLDHELVELAARMPASVKIRGGELKHVMKAALADLLPRDILDRKKRGFGAPMGAWLKGELAPVIRELALAARGRRARPVRSGRGERAHRRARREPHRRHRPAARAAQPRDLVPHLPRRPRARGRRRRAARRRWPHEDSLRLPPLPLPAQARREDPAVQHDQAPRRRSHEVTVASLARSRGRGARRRRASRRTAPSSTWRRVERPGAGARMVATLPTPITVVDRATSIPPRSARTIRRLLRERTLRPDLRPLLVGRAVRGARARRAEDPRLRRHGLAEVARVRALQAVSAERSATGWEGMKLAREEKRLARRFDLCTATTRAEWETLKSYGVGTPSDWFPNGVDSEYFAPADEPYDPDTICFVGRMDYYPNQECMFDFCARTLPLLRAARPGTQARHRRRRPSPAVRKLGELPGVTVTGSVPDVRPYLRRSALTVAPLNIARGTQNKILEAMAMGVPVVTSRVAAGGVDAVAGEHFLVASTPEEYRDAILRILERSRRAPAPRAGRPRADALAPRLAELDEAAGRDHRALPAARVRAASRQRAVEPQSNAS